MEKNLRAPAKINLFLRIVGRRADGYHLVETAMVKLKLADEVRIDVQEGEGIDVTVEGHPELSGETNIAFKAAKLYLAEAGVRKKIAIEIGKRIPIGGGLGGSSTDGAAVLVGLKQLVGGLSPERLTQLAGRLGADVNFFTQSSNIALATGIGEVITPWPDHPSRPVVLVYPGFSSMTADVYRALGKPLTWKLENDTPTRLARPPKNWSEFEGLMEIGNDLEAVVEKRNPVVGIIRKELSAHGASLARMTGSGSTVFGLFDDREKAEEAAGILKRNWETIVTETASSDGKLGVDCRHWGVDKR